MFNPFLRLGLHFFQNSFLNVYKIVLELKKIFSDFYIILSLDI